MKSTILLASATVATAQMSARAPAYRSPYGLMGGMASPVSVSPYGLAGYGAGYGGYGVPAYGGYGGYAPAPVRYAAPAAAPVRVAAAVVVEPKVEKKPAMNPMLLYFLMDDKDDGTFTLKDDGTYVNHKKDDDMLMMMMMGGMYGNGGGMDLLTYKLLQDDKYVVDAAAGSACASGSAGCSVGIGGTGVLTSNTFKKQKDDDNLFLMYAMNGLSGTSAGSGIATGANSMLPLLLMKGF
jgi:hypothetical protein